MRTRKELDCQNHDATLQGILEETLRERRRQVGALIFTVTSLFTSVMLWTDSGGAAESSLDARERMTRGTIEVGIATGYAQGTTVIGAAPSANRSAVFVLPRVGMVLTDPLGKSWWQGNVELLVEPVFARFTKPFAAEGAGGSFVLKYNLLSFGALAALLGCRGRHILDQSGFPDSRTEHAVRIRVGNRPWRALFPDRPDHMGDGRALSPHFERQSRRP